MDLELQSMFQTLCSLRFYTVSFKITCARRKIKVMKDVKCMRYQHPFIKPHLAEKINEMKTLECLRKFPLYASTVTYLFSQICHHVKSAECKPIKRTTHNVQKCSLPVCFWKIRTQRVREIEQIQDNSKT